MGKKRVSFIAQREICREDGSAYLEKVERTPGTYIGSTVTFRLLMCRRKGMGGQWMAKKCRDMRVKEEPINTLDKEVE